MADLLLLCQEKLNLIQQTKQALLRHSNVIHQMMLSLIHVIAEVGNERLTFALPAIINPNMRHT